MSAPRAYSSFIEGQDYNFQGRRVPLSAAFSTAGLQFSLISLYSYEYSYDLFTLDACSTVEGVSLLMWMTVRYDQVMRGALLASRSHSRQLVMPLRAQTSRSAPDNSSKI